MTRFSGLDQWLDWQKTLHPTAIDMGLERVNTVIQRIDCEWPCPLITVAGTNGKGSTLAMLAAIYQSSDYKVGCFTSPHLQNYNERISLNGQNVSDSLLCEAFSVIDEERRELSLTYFEFSTLAAWWIFCRQPLDVVLMEVGLGGRLDSVNAFDPALSIVTTVDLDHEEWLGSDRESVGREKAGIYRAGRPAICGDANPPESLRNHAQSIGSQFYCQGVDFSYSNNDEPYQWQFISKNTVIEKQALLLPEPLSAHQQQNLATALMGVHCLQSILPVNKDSKKLARAVISARLTGRVETLQHSPEIVIDVAHNCEAIAALAVQLRQKGAQKTHAVFSVLCEKKIIDMLNKIADQIDSWHIAALDAERAMPLPELKSALQPYTENVNDYENIWQAFQSARHGAEKQDRILVFGSFYTVAAVLDGLQQEH